MSTNPPPAPAPSGSFLPEEYIKGKAEQRANLICLCLFVLVMTGVIGAFLVSKQVEARVTTAKLHLDEECAAEAKNIEQLKQLEKTRFSMLEKAEVTASLVENVPRSVLMGELWLRLPDGVKLTEVSLKSKRIEATPAVSNTSGGKGLAPVKVKSLEDQAKEQAERDRVTPPKFEHQLTIIGAAGNNNQIADYMRAIKECSLFANVELQYIRETMVMERSLRQFEVNCILRTDVDGRALAPSIEERFKQAAADRNSGGQKSTTKADAQPSAPEHE